MEEGVWGEGGGWGGGHKEDEAVKGKSIHQNKMTTTKTAKKYFQM